MGAKHASRQCRPLDAALYQLDELAAAVTEPRPPEERSAASPSLEAEDLHLETSKVQVPPAKHLPSRYAVPGGVTIRTIWAAYRFGGEVILASTAAPFATKGPGFEHILLPAPKL